MLICSNRGRLSAYKNIVNMAASGVRTELRWEDTGKRPKSLEFFANTTQTKLEHKERIPSFPLSRK
ncbi:MAG: hypothetical protein LBI57_03335 [Helicobacteraceae bacterium]|nr:hypothetical protein [Helicobacteraceae bacterium]